MYELMNELIYEKRVMKRRFAQPLVCSLTALLLLLAATAATPEHDLRHFQPGDYVTGPKLPATGVAGKVVVLEYWGITCPPCIRAIPHTTEVGNQYSRDQVIIIANQVWSAGDRQVKDVWNKHAKHDSVTVVNGGKLASFQPRGVPSVVVFDHTGKSIWEGSPGGIDRVVAQAVANLPKPAEKPADADSSASDQAQGPAPIVTDIAGEHFDREIDLINAQTRRIDATLNKLRRAAELSSRSDQKQEAQAIIDAVNQWAGAQLAQANASLESDPATSYAIADSAAYLLGRDDLAEPFGQIKDKLQKDAEQFDVIRATIALRKAKAQATAIGLDESPAKVDRKKHSKTLRLITRDLQRLASDYPETDAAKQARQLLDAWDLDDQTPRIVPGLGR